MDALGDPTRRAILERLRGGAKPVGELAEGMPVSRPAVSQHLRVLEQAGLVVARKHGTRRLYRLDPDGLDELRAALDSFWSDALAAFAAAAQEEATTMTAETATLSVRKVVRVELPLERAFELFTAGVGSWWPTLTHSIHEADVAELVWEARAGGRLYEVSTSGEEADWADVLVWEPPGRFVLAWRVNPERPLTEVEVRFTDEGETTRVELEHRGWPEETARDGYDGYEKGWDVVLGRFVEAAA